MSNMVEDLIIQKLNLKLTKITFGNSFVNDAKIFLVPNVVRGCKCYLMDCDDTGTILDKGELRLLLITKINEKKLVNTVCLSKSFIMNLDFEEFKHFITAVAKR